MLDACPCYHPVYSLDRPITNRNEGCPKVLDVVVQRREKTPSRGFPAVKERIR